MAQRFSNWFPFENLAKMVPLRKTHPRCQIAESLGGKVILAPVSQFEESKFVLAISQQGKTKTRNHWVLQRSQKPTDHGWCSTLL